MIKAAQLRASSDIIGRHRLYCGDDSLICLNGIRLHHCSKAVIVCVCACVYVWGGLVFGQIYGSYCCSSSLMKCLVGAFRKMGLEVKLCDDKAACKLKPLGGLCVSAVCLCVMWLSRLTFGGSVGPHCVKFTLINHRRGSLQRFSHATIGKGVYLWVLIFSEISPLYWICFNRFFQIVQDSNLILNVLELSVVCICSPSGTILSMTVKFAEKPSLAMALSVLIVSAKMPV